MKTSLGSRRRWARIGRAALVWFVVFAVLEAADMASSFAFHPRQEGNPIVRWAMLDLGDDWVIPKLVLSLAAGAWCAWRWRLGHRVILIGACAVLVFVVAGNIAQQLGLL